MTELLEHDLKCLAVNTGRLKQIDPEFYAWLDSGEAEKDLILRELHDDQPNVVLNVDDWFTIADDYPSASRWLRDCSDAGYHYVFVSQDFGEINPIVVTAVPVDSEETDDE